MAHHIYQTKALILKGMNTGESNRFIDVFTREIGLVRAVARSARKEYSKMRFSLTEYSMLHISLVRGREVWRITGAQEEYNVYHTLKAHPEKLLLFKKVNVVLKRLLHGEERNEALFETLKAFIEFLISEDVPRGRERSVEALVVLRVLYHLGYIEELDGLCTTNEYDTQTLARVEKKQKRIIDNINEALHESQL